MAAPLQLSASATSGSGIDGNTDLTSPVNFQYSAPFAVGSGASSSASQAGGLSTQTIAIIVGGLLVGLVALVTIRSRKPKK